MHERKSYPTTHTHIVLRDTDLDSHSSAWKIWMLLTMYQVKIGSMNNVSPISALAFFLNPSPSIPPEARAACRYTRRFSLSLFPYSDVRWWQIIPPLTVAVFHLTLSASPTLSPCLWPITEGTIRQTGHRVGNPRAISWEGKARRLIGSGVEESETKRDTVA